MLRYQKRLRALAFCYAALAGWVDATGFLKSGGLFVSFMSGNSTRLASGLATIAPAAGAAGSLIFLFVLGVVLNVLVSERAGAGHRKVIAASGVAALLFAAAIADAFEMSNLVIGCLCMAMGAANAIFRRHGDVSIGVTYMTGTLVKFGHRIADTLRGERGTGWLSYLLLWLSLVFGGVAGASSFLRWPHLSLWAVAVTSAGLVGVVSILDAKQD